MKSSIVRLSCGLDIGKSKFHVCYGALLNDGHFVVKGNRSFDNTKTGITAFLKWLKAYDTKYNKSGELPFQVVMETTGVYHENVCQCLYEAGWKVCVELARHVKRYFQSIGLETKTDKLDARGICQLGCERQLRGWAPFSPKIMEIRSALRHRNAMVSSKTRLSNQLHAMNHSANRNKKIVASLKRLIRQLEQEIKKLERLVEQLYKSDKQLYERLEPIILSLKGVGRIGALTVVCENNGFALIKNTKQLASYAGYDIVENQSGTIRKPTRISKKGNARIRKVMYMCAVAVIRSKEGPLYAFYQRIRQRNPKIYKIANVAVQRKLLLLIYTLFKKQTVYDPEYHLKNYKEGSLDVTSRLHEIVLA